MLTPFRVIQIPFNGIPEIDFKGFCWLPTQFALNLARINRIALIGARAVGEEGNEGLVRLGCFVDIAISTERLRLVIALQFFAFFIARARAPYRSIQRPQLIQNYTNGIHHLEVRLLVMPTNVVGRPYCSLGDDLVQRAGMVLNVQPVTDLLPITINRQRPAFEGIQNHQWDQFFRKLVAAVVVRAISD